MSRRSLLAASWGAAGLWALRPFRAEGQTFRGEGQAFWAEGQAAAPALEPTPPCGAAQGATPSATEGPYFRPNSPEREDITDGRYAGRELLVGGYVFDRSCLPVSGALIEIWQAGPDGDYDLSGFHLRGHQYTAEDGRWLFSTVKPAPYRPRARHIHLKVQRPGGAVLTTQMFFPNDPAQARDRQFDPRLVADVLEAERQQARMNIVLS